MKVTGQSVVTPRSKSMIGIPLAHAFSTAGVSAAVVFGATMIASQPLLARSAMSEICFSSLPVASTYVNCLILVPWTPTSACMVVQPTTRHGLPTSALLKQICQEPAFLYLAVSTYVGWIAWSHGWSAAPSG